MISCMWAQERRSSQISPDFEPESMVIELIKRRKSHGTDDDVSVFRLAEFAVIARYVSKMSSRKL